MVNCSNLIIQIIDDEPGTLERGKIHSARARGWMGVSLLENKAELQLVGMAILIGQFQNDRAF